ncbi:MAG: hypothetical protein K2Q32_09435 [Alphaproteobacteria bacterium]|nr:hypothetical protein [Alphaproteobacteria bacterium]
MLTDPKRIKAAEEIKTLFERYRVLRDLYKTGNDLGVYSYNADATVEQRAATDKAASRYFSAKAVEAPIRRAAETIQLNNEIVDRTGQGMYL